MNSIQKKIIKIASNILADYKYIYDPEHKKNPGGGYERTEKGWSKEKTKNNGRGTGEESFKPHEKMDEYQKRLHDTAINGGVEEKLNVAGDRMTHPYTLHILSRDKNRDVRETVADNETTHPKTLKRLSKDDEWTVRALVAQNPNTSTDCLVELSNDKKTEVRMGVASNNYWRRPRPVKMLEKLYNDENLRVRNSLLDNGTISEKLLKKFELNREKKESKN